MPRSSSLFFFAAMFWLIGGRVGLLAQLAPTDASRGLRDLNLPRLVIGDGLWGQP